MLLLDAGRIVTVERLIDGLYGDDPPAGVANALQSQVSRLRAALGVPVENHPAGYRLVADRDDIDAHCFERLAARGREALAAGEYGRAAGLTPAPEAVPPAVSRETAPRGTRGTRGPSEATSAPRALPASRAAQPRQRTLRGVVDWSWAC